MQILVKRKLFATGDSLAVTLPKAWINYFRLKAGDFVEMVAGDDVVIRAAGPEGNTDSHTDLTGPRQRDNLEL